MKWEYRHVQVPGSSFKTSKDVERWYNALGADGWECCSISPSGEAALFKRPKVADCVTAASS